MSNYYVAIDKDGNYVLAHAERRNHKYIRKEGNRYIYPEDLRRGRATDAVSRGVGGNKKNTWTHGNGETPGDVARRKMFGNDRPAWSNTKRDGSSRGLSNKEGRSIDEAQYQKYNINSATGKPYHEDLAGGARYLNRQAASADRKRSGAGIDTPQIRKDLIFAQSMHSDKASHNRKQNLAKGQTAVEKFVSSAVKAASSAVSKGKDLLSRLFGKRK